MVPSKKKGGIPKCTWKEVRPIERKTESCWFGISQKTYIFGILTYTCNILIYLFINSNKFKKGVFRYVCI